MYPEKPKFTNSFEGLEDSDTSDALIAPNRARFMFNVRTQFNGEKGVVTNVKGNILVSTPLPPGMNIAHGWGADEEQNMFIFAVFNSNGYHTFFKYDGLKNTIVKVLQSITDSNGIDILRFNKDYLINHMDIIGGDKIYFTDGFNRAGKFNINKAMDKTSTGYGLTIFEDFVRAYKQTNVYSPNCKYVTDPNRNSNNLYRNLYKFCVRLVYDDGEKSNWSDWSNVPLPPNQAFTGINEIKPENNCIELTFNSGNQLVVKIEVAMQTGILPWVMVTVLDKKTLKIGDNTDYTYKFYNDGAHVALDQEKIFRHYSYLPYKPFNQAFVRNALTYSKFYEGFPSVNIDVEVSVSYNDLFIPDGSQSQTNNPSFVTTLISNGYSSGSLGVIGSRQNVQQRFQIGFDVKKGNRYFVMGYNAQSANYTFEYIAKANDTATTVANFFKSAFRGIGRSVPDGNGISNEATDGSGNVRFDYTFLGFWKESPVKWTTYVEPVNFDVLKDDGLSVQLIKPGSIRKYALAYEGEDEQKGLANTSDKAVIRTGFITEVGDLKQAVHTIKINHQPPEWAKYYYLLRTPDSGPFIQLLIQKVSEVSPDPAMGGDSQKYLDLIVGSLFTYQKLHPNTILNYEFTKGDRLRLIKYFDVDNDNNPIFYPYYETEVLSYKVEDRQVINANLRTSIGDGAPNTDRVTPSDGPKLDNIGKYIEANGNERLIIGVQGADYVLDQPINLENSANNSLYLVPSYTIIDRRSAVRIKLPPQPIDVKDFSLVEIYKDQNTDDINGNKQFYPFGVKLEILNAGTDQRAHAGTVQNQNGANPAIITTSDGDAYSRNRELPSNNSVPGTQFIIDHVIDPNYSDYYDSDLKSLGRVFAQDDGSGRKWFGSRIRFSNNYLQDTRINGLNDYDNTDREDYNDAYGDINLMRFVEDRLYIFKPLRTAWIGILQSIIVDNKGTQVIGTSSKLLNQIQYYAWDGGIGNNPESYARNGNYQYFASAPSGVFLRLSGGGCDPISTIYDYDKRGREILGYVAKYGLRIYGGFDRENSDMVWSVPAFNNYIFKGGFVAPDWNIYNDELPVGATVAITQQPAKSSVTINGNGRFELTAGNVVGGDSFKYQITLPDGTILPERNFCFEVLQPANRLQAWRGVEGSEYCLLSQSVWRGQAGSEYCLVRNIAWRGVVGTEYCLQSQSAWRGQNGSEYCLVRASAWRGINGTEYCLQVPGVTINSNVDETHQPYSDGNVQITIEGELVTRHTGNGFESHQRPAGKMITFENFSEAQSMGSNPTKTMVITRTVGGVTQTIYGPQTSSNNPGDPPNYYEEVGVDHAEYYAAITTYADNPEESVACGVPTPYSGSSVFPLDTIIDLGTGIGVSTLTFDAIGVPDKFQVFYNGQMVIDTGYRGDTTYQNDLDAELAARGYPPEQITSPASGSAEFNKNTSARYALVKVFAPLPGTAWKFTLGCPA